MQFDLKQKIILYRGRNDSRNLICKTDILTLIGMRAERWGDSFLEIEMRAKISVFLASKFKKKSNSNVCKKRVSRAH